MRTSLWSHALAGLLMAAAGVVQGGEPMVAARHANALVLKSDGTVVGWGSNADGQLGNGRVLFDPTPKQLPNLPAMVQTASSQEHVVALDVHGRIWTWGASTHARLGVRAQRNPANPGRVRGIRDAIAVAASNYASFALKADGTVWMWGGNQGVGCWGPAWGPRGTYQGDGWPEPFQITSLTNIVQMSAGHDYLLMRTRAGTVVTLGSNWFGVAGDGTIDQGGNCSPRSPVTVPGLSNITYVAAGATSAHAVTADGKLYSWGDVWGYGPEVLAPARVLVFPRPVRKVVGAASVYALLDDGTVWGWASNGGSVDNPPPAAVSQVPGLSAIEELAKPSWFPGHSVYARDSSGRLFAYSRNNFGEMGLGLVNDLEPVATQVPLPAPVKTMSVGFFGVVAITTDGATWTWGRDGLGLLGRGDAGVSAVPVPVSGLHDIRKLVVGRGSAFALDGSGTVWGWGNNEGRQMGTSAQTPSSIPLQVDGGTAIVDIAASWMALVMVGSDGKVRINGQITRRPSQTEPVQGLPPITRVAGGYAQAIFLTADGELWTMGTNAWGELGDGTTTTRETPVKITGIPPVAQVVSDFTFTMALTKSGEVWGWGQNGVVSMDGSPQGYSLVPQRLPGLSGIVEIAAGMSQALARRSDGTVLSWGVARGRDGNAQVPAPVDGLDEVVSIAVAQGASYAIRADGTVWGWGGVVCESDACPLPGDGTFVIRDRPVVVIREDGKGNLDTNDWFLDAKPGTPKRIPAAKVPKVIPVTKALSSSGLFNVDASVNVRRSDQSKTLGLYVVGLVPAAFLDQVKTAPGALAKRAGLKDGELVLVNLTPSGWTVASGQLSAYQSGTGSAALAATNLLVNVNPATIPGARFCIGYGESASDMLSTGTVRDFLSLPGASSSASGLPCLQSGVYVDGPPTSQLGAAVPMRAVVVGLSPTGTVRFRERFSDISSDMAIEAVNPAVSLASLAYTPPGAGEYAFVASYPGDGANAAATSEVPLRHVVNETGAGTTTQINAPVTSEVGMEVRLVAQVTGNRPGGTVQFTRDGVAEAGPVPVVDDQAVLSVVGLGIGEYRFTASYSGDANSAASASEALVHRVLDVAMSEATLASSANPAPLGTSTTLTATVTGGDPPSPGASEAKVAPNGTARLREGGRVIATAPVVNGRASFTVPGLGAGVHVFNVDYGGDASNPATTSNPVFQQVTLTGTPVALTVTRGGLGSGAVGSLPSGLSCGTRCTAQYPSGAQVTLAATPASGSTFAGWSGGGCSGTGSCTVALTAATTVSATFNSTTTATIRLSNLSTRGQVQTGDNVMIGGFIVGGSAPKKVLITARGPSLTAFAVQGAMANPALALYAGQTVIASNDDWGSASNAAEIRALGRAPSSALESAILTTLSPGAYTVVVSGVSGGTGVGIVEVFELDRPDIPLTNLSTRGQVQTGDNVMIGGFVIDGTQPKTVLITARGPSLAAFGVSGALANPSIQLYSGQTIIAANDDWQTASNATAIQATGLAPTNPLESAILVTLNPGAYTAIVSGADGGTGVGIVEVFAR